jgi:CheY-like chemotaxis protein
MKTSKNLIIIVDDDADDRMLCQEYFGRANDDYELVLLSSGEELFSYLDTIPRATDFPHLILLDYNMPKMTGGEILLQLRRQPRYASLKVALYSSGMSSQLQNCVMGLQVAHCFNKPVSVEEFTRMSDTIRSIIQPGMIYLA